MAGLTSRFASAAVAGTLAWLTLPGQPVSAGEPASFPARADAQSGTARLYVLVFADKPVGEVAGQVLGEMLQIPFEIDPAVSGKMSLVVEERLTRDQLLGVFEAALARNGVAIARVGAVIKLVPLTHAQPSSPAARRRTSTSHRGDEVVSSALMYGPPNAATASTLPIAHRDPWALAKALLAGLGLLTAVLTAAAVIARWKGLSFGYIRAASPRQAVLAWICRTTRVDAQTLAAARVTAAESGRPVEHVLNRMGAISDDALVRAYAAVTGLAVWSPEELPPLLWAADMGLQTESLTRRGLVPVACGPGRLTLATSDPLDDAGLAGVALETACVVSILVCAPADVRRAIAAA